MLIGDIARQSDVTPATIRYYEEIGLLTSPPRTAGGYRRYSTATLDELEFIRKGQGLGFSLEEIGEILKLSRAGEAPCSHVLELAERNLAAADDRIHQLQHFRERLAAQISKWKGRSMPNCNGSSLCEIITSAELPEKAADR
jgi:MerR family transcriptional regulator, copper efflux regulator